MNAVILPKDKPREDAVTRLLETAMSLPVDRAWRFEWEAMKSERTLQQNKYLFGCAYKMLSEQTGYEKDDLHEYLLGKHFGTKLKRVPKTKYNPQGIEEVPLRTTTTDEEGNRCVLGKMEFVAYVEFVQRFAAKIGIVIPNADPYWYQRDNA